MRLGQSDGSEVAKAESSVLIGSEIRYVRAFKVQQIYQRIINALIWCKNLLDIIQHIG